jgi:hypothetical protein
MLFYSYWFCSMLLVAMGVLEKHIHGFSWMLICGATFFLLACKGVLRLERKTKAAANPQDDEDSY